MPMTVPKLLTPGRLAEELGVALPRVQHILRTRLHIQPAARAGILRLYNRESLAQVRYEVNKQDARRAKGGPDA